MRRRRRRPETKTETETKTNPLLVQSAERLTVNQKVAGSIPAKRNRTYSSIGQSIGLMSRRFWVQVPICAIQVL